MSDIIDESKAPFAKLMVQPASHAVRFRYQCEGRFAGSIPGNNSTMIHRTYPLIKIFNYKGPAQIAISCVTKDKNQYQKYMPHPHNVICKGQTESDKPRGYCVFEIFAQHKGIAEFRNIGIQCVKRKEVEEALTRRETYGVDPFGSGFEHKSCPSEIDLNSLRLCFEVTIPGPCNQKIVLPPVVSDPIYDKKQITDLYVHKFSHYSAPVTGGQEVIILCEKVSRDDIAIRFFQEDSQGHLLWEDFGIITVKPGVYKQVAIVFTTPAYSDLKIQDSVDVYVQLKRPSDGESSIPYKFQLTPDFESPDNVKRKRAKLHDYNSPSMVVASKIQEEAQKNECDGMVYDESCPNAEPTQPLQSNMNRLNIDKPSGQRPKGPRVILTANRRSQKTTPHPVNNFFDELTNPDNPEFNEFNQLVDTANACQQQQQQQQQQPQQPQPSHCSMVPNEKTSLPAYYYPTQIRPSCRLLEKEQEAVANLIDYPYAHMEQHQQQLHQQQHPQQQHQQQLQQQLHPQQQQQLYEQHQYHQHMMQQQQQQQQSYQLQHHQQQHQPQPQLVHHPYQQIMYQPVYHGLSEETIDTNNSLSNIKAEDLIQDIPDNITNMSLSRF